MGSQEREAQGTPMHPWALCVLPAPVATPPGSCPALPGVRGALGLGQNLRRERWGISEQGRAGGQHLTARSYDWSLSEAGQQDFGPRLAALQGLLGPPHLGNRPEGTWGAQGRGLRGCGRGWGGPPGRVEWTGGTSPCQGDTKGQCGPSPAAQGVGGPALPAPGNMGCTFPRCLCGQKEEVELGGGTQPRVGAGLERQPLGVTLESCLRDVSPPAPRPTTRGCLQWGLRWTQGPPLAQGP